MGISIMDHGLSKNRRLTLIAMISTVAYVGRIMFSFIPNVQPTTTIIILVTIYIGTIDGLLVAITTMFMSNLYLGMGPWTIAQIFAFSMIVGMFHIIKKTNLSIKYYPVIAFFSGLFYGFVISLVQAPFFGWALFFPYWISGISFDIYHALGNYVFFIILYRPIGDVFINRRKQYE